MDVIPYESSSFYVFDRAYNDYHRLYKIHMMDSFLLYGLKQILRRKYSNRNDVYLRIYSPTVRLNLPVSIPKIIPWNDSFGEVLGWRRRKGVHLSYKCKHIQALQVAELYKNRWQVELFFKWLKQHLKIKKFWGTSENAVKIQVYSAIIAYCLVAIMQHDMKLDRSTYEVLQILGISLTDKTPLRDLFSKTKFNDVKEQSGLDGPNLFSNYNFNSSSNFIGH